MSKVTGVKILGGAEEGRVAVVLLDRLFQERREGNEELLLLLRDGKRAAFTEASPALSSSNLYASASKHEDGTKPGRKDQMVASG